MKFTIIVPAYNSEAYLGRCLESCLDQDLPEEDYEIVVVNDGSTDDTLSIAEHFMTGHPAVKIISQENGGLSRARNAGLALAAGEYVWFVDSDDTIASHCLGVLYEQAVKVDADILAMCAAIVKEGIVTPRRFYDKGVAGTVLSGPQMLRRGMLQESCAPFFIYKRSYLTEKEFSFLPGVFHEDEEWTPRVIYNAERILFTDEVYYYVYSRPGSIMSTPDPKRSMDIVKVAESLHAFGNTVPEKDRHLISARITRILNYALKLSLKYSEEDLARFQAEMSEKKFLIGHFMKSGALKFRLEGLMLSIFPGKSVYVYRFLNKLAAIIGMTEKPQGRGY